MERDVSVAFLSLIFFLCFKQHKQKSVHLHCTGVVSEADISKLIHDLITTEVNENVCFWGVWVNHPFKFGYFLSAQTPCKEFEVEDSMVIEAN